MTDARAGSSDAAAHRITLQAYGLYLLGLLVVFPAIIGALLNYRYRDRVAGTPCASHFAWQLRTFWWMAGWCLVSGALMLFGHLAGPPIAGSIGAVILLVAICWFLFRLLKGYLFLIEGRGVPGYGPDAGTRTSVQ